METNSIVHTIEKTRAGEVWIIKISLNDECRNGHQDFSITADVYQAGKPRTDRYWLSGGAKGDEIAKYWPELAPFNALHLCDFKGQPMHGPANARYHIRNGKPERAQKMLRATDAEMAVLATAADDLHMAVLIESLGIRARWADEAAAAIKTLESWTGKTFVNDSRRDQWPFDEAQMQDGREKGANGHYSPANVKTRADEAAAAKIAKERARIEAKRDKEIDKATKDAAIHLAILDTGTANDNFIYYDHTDTVSFNWRGYGDTFTPEQVATLGEMLTAKFPGITITTKQ